MSSIDSGHSDATPKKELRVVNPDPDSGPSQPEQVRMGAREFFLPSNSQVSGVTQSGTFSTEGPTTRVAKLTPISSDVNVSQLEATRQSIYANDPMFEFANYEVPNNSAAEAVSGNANDHATNSNSLEHGVEGGSSQASEYFNDPIFQLRNYEAPSMSTAEAVSGNAKDQATNSNSLERRLENCSSPASSTYDANLSAMDMTTLSAANDFMDRHDALGHSNPSASGTSLAATGEHAVGSLHLASDTSEGPKEKQVTANFPQLPTSTRTQATLLFSNFPKEFTLGLDTGLFAAADKSTLVGVTGIPAGAHFLYGGASELSRSGVWMICGGKYMTTDREVIVMKWSAHDELIVEEGSAAETVFKAEEALTKADEILQYYAPVQQALLGFAGGAKDSALDDIWRRVSYGIRGPMLSRVTSQEWNCWKVESNDNSYGFQPRKLSPVMTFLFDREGKMYDAEAVGSERSDQAQDASWLVTKVSLGPYGDDIVGEIQFTYLTGMLVGNVVCMEQWGFMVKLLFKAFVLPVKQPHLYRKIIQTVHDQMIYDRECLEGSIFEYSPSLEEDLKKILTIFKKRLGENFDKVCELDGSLNPKQKDLRKAFENFESYLNTNWQWELSPDINRLGKLRLEDGEEVDMDASDLDGENDCGEFAPVICDENGQEVETLRHLSPW